jgi:hypothetical protein
MTPLLLAFLVVTTDGIESSEDWFAEHPNALIGVGAGATAGALVGVIGVGGFSALCVPSAKCPWGNGDQAVVGLYYIVPMAALAGGITGGVVGGLVGAGFDTQPDAPIAGEEAPELIDRPRR